MKQVIRRYGIGPPLDHEGKPLWALFEVDEIGNTRGPPFVYNADREVLVRAIEHLHGVFDDRIEWVDRATAPGASVVSLVPPSKSLS